MNFCLFEDNYISRLSPVNLLRHTSEIICGVSSNFDSVFSLIKKEPLSLHSRVSHQNYLRSKFSCSVNEFNNEPYIFLNSRVLFDKEFIKSFISLADEGLDTSVIIDDTVVCFFLTQKSVSKLSSQLSSELISLQFLLDNKIYTTPLHTGLKILSYSWDIIKYFPDIITHQLGLMVNLKSKRKELTKKQAENKKDVFISSGCNIAPNVFFNASKGPVYISKGVKIEPFVYIEGPVYVGRDSTIKSNSSLYGPVSVGEHSKISGEIASSVLHSYVNKQHYGFLGHSYLCEWVNLGAGTTTSNLKNNYSNISVKIQDENLDTGSIFLGSIIGDHTKTGICTMLNTGSLIGMSCNIFGGGFQEKKINSFSWVDSTAGSVKKYEIDKALKTAKISMKRRDVEMTPEYEKLFKSNFDKTE